MARYSHPSPNILKLRKSNLLVNVTPIPYYDHRLPCPSSCSASPFHITFITHLTHRFLDPRRLSLSSSFHSSPRLIGEYQQVVGRTTICQDGTLFFNSQEKANSRLAVKTALRSLNVKKSRHDKIFKQVMAFGRRYNDKRNDGRGFKKLRVFGRGYKNRSNDKEVLKGLVVAITIEQSFIGDREAVNEVMQKSWEESKSQARGDGDTLFLVN
ncbi:hypothetical protein DCAR_0102530 [Daucus carota subsp. sativus]|uniref:Uncharacterized protein n=1 Tax=Daucus carota subsp. sativus TaxID=79200 RepID=A0A166H6B9_DAUCS|nr:hypothetical protein DCAR_0102530 [Daucus carota subsp. sativus]